MNIILITACWMECITSVQCVLQKNFCRFVKRNIRFPFVDGRARVIRRLINNRCCGGPKIRRCCMRCAVITLKKSVCVFNGVFSLARVLKLYISVDDDFKGTGRRIYAKMWCKKRDWVREQDTYIYTYIRPVVVCAMCECRWDEDPKNATLLNFTSVWPTRRQKKNICDVHDTRIGFLSYLHNI